MKIVIVISVLILSLTACTTTTQSLEASNFTKLKGAEILNLLPGNSLRGMDSTGRYIIYYTSNSTMKITYTTKKRTRRDVGRWRIAGDQYCRIWTDLGKGEERCVSLYKRDDAIHWVLDNKVTDRSVLVDGNPAEL